MSPRGGGILRSDLFRCCGRSQTEPPLSSLFARIAHGRMVASDSDFGLSGACARFSVSGRR